MKCQRRLPEWTLDQLRSHNYYHRQKFCENIGHLKNISGSFILLKHIYFSCPSHFNNPCPTILCMVEYSAFRTPSSSFNKLTYPAVEKQLIVRAIRSPTLTKNPIPAYDFILLIWCSIFSSISVNNPSTCERM